MTPETVIGVKFAQDGVMLFFTILRIIATRKLKRTTEKVWANIFLFLTFVCDFTSTAVFTWIMVEQSRILKKYGGDKGLADMEIIRADLGKVCVEILYEVRRRGGGC